MATPVRLIRNEFEFQERAAGREPPKVFRGKAAEAVSKGHAQDPAAPIRR